MIEKLFSIIKNKFYLIITVICVGFYALFCFFLVKKKFLSDFLDFYEAGIQVFINPLQLYDIHGFYYMPNFALLFGITFSLFPSDISYYLFYCFNYILAIIFVLEFNRILILMDIEKKIHRLMFLLIISNGWFLYFQFFHNQSKFIVGVILLFIIRREIQYKKEKIEKNFKYYLINYSLFIFAIGTAPYFIFLLLIYVFHDITFIDLLKKENIKHYLIVVCIFAIQNFLFFFYPSLIFDFISGFSQSDQDPQLTLPFYLNEWIFISRNIVNFLKIVAIVILLLVTLTLILQKKLTLEEKFGYFAISFILIGMFSCYPNLLNLISLFLLLIVPYLNKIEIGFNFIKKNITFFIELISIMTFSFMIPNTIIYKYISILQNYPFVYVVNLRFILLLCSILILLILLNYKYNRF